MYLFFFYPFHKKKLVNFHKKQEVGNGWRELVGKSGSSLLRAFGMEL